MYMYMSFILSLADGAPVSAQLNYNRNGSLPLFLCPLSKQVDTFIGQSVATRDMDGSILTAPFMHITITFIMPACSTH